MSDTMENLNNGQRHDMLLSLLGPSDTKRAIDDISNGAHLVAEGAVQVLDRVSDVAGKVVCKTAEAGLPLLTVFALGTGAAAAEPAASRVPVAEVAYQAPRVAETPVATSHPVVCADGEVKAIYGTNATKISKAAGMTLEQFAAANADRIDNINNIYAGHCYKVTTQEGLVRGDYVVKAGDTMGAISKNILKETGVMFLPSELAKNSGIRNANRIRPGMHVYFDYNTVKESGGDIPEAPFSPVTPAAPKTEAAPAPAPAETKAPIVEVPPAPEASDPTPVAPQQPNALVPQDVQPEPENKSGNDTIDHDWNLPIGPNKPFKTEQEALEFQYKVIEICQELGFDPDFLMNAMGFESASTYDPAKQNAAGSGATGLIQFMPKTAIGMGTTVEVLAKMSPLEQLDYVKQYFESSAGQLHDMRDVYLKIFYPILIGKAPDAAIANKDYPQNKGLDSNKDGKDTKDEITQHLVDRLNDTPLLETPIKKPNTQHGE